MAQGRPLCKSFGPVPVNRNAEFVWTKMGSFLNLILNFLPSLYKDMLHADDKAHFLYFLR